MTAIRKWLLLPVLVGLLAITSISAGGPPFDPNSDPGLDRARQAANDSADGLFGIGPRVVGVGVGQTASGEYAVVVLTESEGVDVPSSVDGVPVVVQVTGRIWALPKPEGKGKPPKGEDPDIDPKGRCDRPVPIGVSTGHPAITAGTIGARVTDGTDVFALSNNHVYADVNAASIGDVVIQPGTYDGGSSPADDIGELAAFEPISFTSDNIIDAAIALTGANTVVNATPGDGYGTPTVDYRGGVHQPEGEEVLANDRADEGAGLRHPRGRVCPL